MDRRELRERSRFFYTDELQYAIAQGEQFETDFVRERATMRLTREMKDEDIRELCRGMVDSVARNVEREFVVELDGPSQLKIGGAIRTADKTLCPIDKARVRDWLAFDEMREQVFRAHATKRVAEREAIQEIIDRLRAHGGDPTTFEACPDLFASQGAA